MYMVVGPVRTTANGYAFDVWTLEAGLCAGFAYTRVEDAHYARNAEIRERRGGDSGRAIICGTSDEFFAKIAALSAKGPT